MIRLLVPDEFEIFRRIRLEALRAEPAAFASTAADWEALSDEEWRRRLEANAVFVAFRDGEPVGIMGLMPQQPSKMAHRATIIMVYVRMAERGNGLAATLLNAITDHARRSGIRQLELLVSAENPLAIGFYKKQGYREVGRVPAGFIHEGNEIDDILMVSRIDA